MGKLRDSDRTKAKILGAAAREFVQHGFDGASLADIAKRARASKQLILHHFASKEELFHAVLDEKFRAALEVADPLVEDPAAIIAERFRRRANQLDYIRFLTWEAASARTDEIPAHAIRQRRVSEFGHSIRQMRTRGQLPAELDPALLQLAILSLATYPMAFAQITQLVTGKVPTDAAFQREWYEFLKVVGRRLLGEPGTDAPKAAPRSRKRS
jgi:TetR/AcrR family transcriptional regulator